MERTLLSRSDYDVVVARDGREAVKQAIDHNPDLIILDVVMPNMDGFEACRELRRLEPTRDIPVIMVTTRGEGHHVENGFEVGCNDYVTKPISGPVESPQPDRRVGVVMTTNEELAAENEALRARIESMKAAAEEQMANMASLYIAVNSLHAALDRTAVLASVQDVVTTLIGSEEMAIFEVDRDHRRLSLLASQGIDAGRYQDVTLGNGLIGTSASTGEAVIRKEGGSTERDGDDAITACVPMKIGQRVLGVIAIFRLLPHKGELISVDLDLLDLLSTHAAVALLFTRLYSEMDHPVGVPL
jgi:CheY-like chemotaxis protein